jgi:hypothetical protein
MASFHCSHCSRPVFLRHRQLPSVSGLCVPCDHRSGEQRRADQAWRKFRERLLSPADAVPIERPLLPLADLRHL